MNAKYKFIPAVALLLISAVMLSTASYAWFSMSAKVTATGMTVTAMSDASYLVIDTVDNKTDKSGSGGTIDVNSSATVFPAAYLEGGSISVGSLRIGSDTWYTANNRNFDDANDDIIDGRVIECGDPDYMLTNTFYLTLLEGSVDYDEDLLVSFTREEGCDNAVSAVVVIGEGDEKQNFNFFNNIGLRRYSLASNPLTSSTSLKVTVYTYINGNSVNVNSEYISNGNIITGDISLAFNLVPPETIPPDPELPEPPPEDPVPPEPPEA